MSNFPYFLAIFLVKMIGNKKEKMGKDSHFFWIKYQLKQNISISL